MRRIPFEIWLVALVLIANLYAVFLPPNSLVMQWFRSDDAFYYFKTAQNIAEGRGITFDGLGRDSGFHPLWMAVITPIFALARVDLILPLRLVVLVSGLLCAGTALVLYRLARRYLHPLAAGFVALFWAFYPMIHQQVTEMGLESPLSAFLIALLVYRVVREDDEARDDSARDDSAREYAARDYAARDNSARSVSGRKNTARWLVTGLVAALTVLARLDNIFLVGILGAWLAFRPARARYLLVTDAALILLGVLWAYLSRVGFGALYAQYAASQYVLLAAALALRVGLYFLFRLYERPAPGWKGLAAQLLRAAAASALASGLLAGAMLGLYALRVLPGFPRMVLVYEGGFGLAAVLLTRTLAAARLLRAAGEPERAAVQPPAEQPLRWGPTFARLVCYFAPLALALVLYMGFSQAYFGTLMPVSGQIKRWWGTLPNTIYGRPVESLKGLLGVLPRSSPWALARKLASFPVALPEGLRLLVYGGLAAALLLWQPGRTRQSIHRLGFYPLLAGSFIQLISYTGTAYIHMRDWYWVSHLMATTLLLGILVDSALCLVDRIAVLRAGLPRERVKIVLAAGLSVLVIGLGISSMVRSMPMYVRPARATFYLDSIHELEANTPPGARIGSTGGGVIAYFISDRTIVNMDGLMNTTAYFKALQTGRAAAYLDGIGLDYVFTSEYAITSSDPYFQFKGKLKKLKAFGGAALFKWQ